MPTTYSQDLQLVHALLDAFADEYRPVYVEALGAAGGFSGARFWKLWDGQGRCYCLRRWPPAASKAHLGRVHELVRAIWQEAFRKIPLPIAAKSGETLLERDRRLWQLEPWMPGKADFHSNPSPARLHAAMQALAQFHLAAARADGRAKLPLSQPSSPPNSGRAKLPLSRLLGDNTARQEPPPAGFGFRTSHFEFPLAPSPSLLARRDELRHLLAGGLAQWHSVVQSVAPASRRCSPGGGEPAQWQGVVQSAPISWPDFHRRACRLLELFPRAAPAVLDELDWAAAVPVELQTCLHDVWHDHVLFQGDEVSALIDFGSLQTDTVAADLARLLGSLVRESRVESGERRAMGSRVESGERRAGQSRVESRERRAGGSSVESRESRAGEGEAPAEPRASRVESGERRARKPRAILSTQDSALSTLPAYDSLRPLSPAERRLIPIFDHSATLLGGFTWLRWLYLEQRPFANPAAALQRLDNIVQRLEHLAAQSCGRLAWPATP